MSEWVVFRRNENGSGWTRTDVPDFEIPVGAHHHVEAARRVAQTLGPGRYAVAAASLHVSKGVVNRAVASRTERSTL